MRKGFRIVAGRAFTPGTFEVIVGRRLARDFRGLEIGTTVTGAVQEWRIVGVFEDGGGSGESEVWTDLEPARAEAGPRNDVSSLRIKLASVGDVSRLRSAFASDPRRQLQVVSERDYHARQSAVLIGRVRWLAVGLALLLGIGAVVATINTMYGAISARQRSVATMRVLGFDGAPVAAAVFLEAALLGLAGGVFGGLAAFALADGFGLSLLNVSTHTPLAFDTAVTIGKPASGRGLRLWSRCAVGDSTQCHRCADADSHRVASALADETRARRITAAASTSRTRARLLAAAHGSAFTSWHGIQF